MHQNRLALPPSYSDPEALANSLWGRGTTGFVEVLNHMTCPVTLLMAELVGEPIRVETYHEVTRPATPRECAFLGCPAETTVSFRQGTMRGGAGRIGFFADVESTVIPALLPKGADKDLKGNVPLGAIIAKIAKREPLGAIAYMGGAASTSRLWTDDGKYCIASASEHFMPWFCTLLNKSNPR
jgi:hypothetical protein